MSILRIHGADAAHVTPADDQAEEFFGRTPRSLQRRTDISPAAKHVYSVITRLMAEDREPTYCFHPMHVIAFEAGLKTRYTREMIAELESAGYVERERVRTRGRSPQGIRPLARLKSPRNDPSNRHHSADCNRHHSAEHSAPEHREPGTIAPSARHHSAAPLKREGEKEEILRVRTTTAATGSGSPPPASAPEADPENPPPTAEEFAAFRASLGLTPERVALATARTTSRSEGARKRPRDFRQVTPEALSSSANPGSPEPTTPPAGPATHDGNLYGDC
jgi:hypothetical protein